MSNTLFYGDCLDILQKSDLDGRKYVDDNSIDLIYLDPPFNSNKIYNVIFREPTGNGATSQVKGFEDTWTWNDNVASEMDAIMSRGDKLSDTLLGLQKILGYSNMFAYLVMMSMRLSEMRRVLKDTGTIYLHCDQTAGHYIKIVLDSIFGPENFRNEIIWQYQPGSCGKKDFGRKHDTIFRYSKTDDYVFYSDSVREPYSPKTLERLKHKGAREKDIDKVMSKGGRTPIDVWYYPSVQANSEESVGYPTQKPEALLERIILSSTREGDAILDPFCGCGTAICVAERLRRKWLGIDITAIAINIIKNRMAERYPGIIFKVVGEPKTPEDARMLADSSNPEDKFQFQLWALGLDNARPVGKLKRGSDKGIDGKKYFMAPGRKMEMILYSVKSGNVSTKDVRDLSRVIDREGAAIGVLISMNPIKKTMYSEAATMGHYTPDGLDGDKYARIQLYTVDELMSSGKQVCWPRYLDNPGLSNPNPKTIGPLDRKRTGKDTTTTTTIEDWEE